MSEVDNQNDLYVQINFDGDKRLASLVNISSTGACVELVDRGQYPGNNIEIELQLLLPGKSESLSLLARVVWSRNLSKDTTSKSVNVGVQFKETDEQARECLWSFIVDAETATQKQIFENVGSPLLTLRDLPLSD